MRGRSGWRGRFGGVDSDTLTPRGKASGVVAKHLKSIGTVATRITGVRQVGLKPAGAIPARTACNES